MIDELKMFAGRKHLGPLDKAVIKSVKAKIEVAKMIILQGHIEYSSKKLAFKMDDIINRLLKSGHYEKEFLLDVIEDLSQRKWSKPKIVAYLDILDVEDRT